MNYYKKPADPRWLPVTNVTQLPTVSTQITDGGMYKFEANTTAWIIIDDAPITLFPNNDNAAIIMRGEYEPNYQYIKPGQYIRCNTSAGSMVKLG